MTYAKSTAEMLLLLEEILHDIPKALKGNKTAAQRIRSKTVRFTKVSKEWRRKSLDLERKKPLKKKGEKKGARAAKSVKKGLYNK